MDGCNFCYTHQRAIVLHPVFNHSRNAKWLFGRMALIDQLFVAGLKNMQVQVFTGVNDNPQKKYWNKIGHAQYKQIFSTKFSIFKFPASIFSIHTIERTNK